MATQPVRKSDLLPHDPAGDQWPGPTGHSNPAPRRGGQPTPNLIDNPPAASLEQALRNSAAQVEQAKGDNWKP